jgi:hypothetical protein
MFLSIAGTPWRHTGELPEPIVEQPHLAWARWISPETLISQVQSTAPYIDALLPPAEPGRLSGLGNSQDGFLRIISSWRNILRDSLAPEEQLQDYFALCLACHHATVATFVPTDVDTKIRGIVWRESRDPDVLQPMLRLALAARAWTEEGISVRSVRGVAATTANTGAPSRAASAGWWNSATLHPRMRRSQPSKRRLIASGVSSMRLRPNAARSSTCCASP